MVGRTIGKIIGSIGIIMVVWFIPVTAKVIESLARSAIMALGTAENLNDVNIGIARLILAGVLLLLLLVLFRNPSRTRG